MTRFLAVLVLMLSISCGSIELKTHVTKHMILHAVRGDFAAQCTFKLENGKVIKTSGLCDFIALVEGNNYRCVDVNASFALSNYAIFDVIGSPGECTLVQ